MGENDSHYIRLKSDRNPVNGGSNMPAALKPNIRVAKLITLGHVNRKPGSIS